MHGSVQREGEGCSTSPGRCISWHMHSAVIAADSKSFFKDGRRISVGDCALFKPPQDSPPFIGLIRWLILSKENRLQLGVNWLYRPAELKLGKGTLLDGAPNEIFYSFHKDEIPAASLLHPCKVAFLPRGVELPAGTSSFVCRRVYDIENECLWWLTDQDYINERQEEVDNLLYKTRTEMHATLQPGGRSPKQVNGPSSTAQLKSGSDNVQSSGTSFASHIKGKKRERGDRGDHGADPVKRERSSRIDDDDSANHKNEGNLRTEIARITEKGGVVDLEGVEKLVQLMQQKDKMERKMDLGSRSMLAGVIAAIDKVDCLNQFVYLGGLPVMDEWLQDIHKGKIGGGNSSKDSDKSIEEFLLVLLRALDKLPVNLHALQTCNIGKSVNHLRSHKHLEIQRKARSLVETWKKRVEAEMISNDAKSGSTQAVAAWSSKSRLPEASHGGCRTPTGSDVAIKSSVIQNTAAKIASVRSSHGESIKHATLSPGPVKPASSPSSGKESQHRTSVVGTADATQIREDRSSSSGQSHNYGQSFPVKEEMKCSPSGLATVNKISNSNSRNRKISGFPGISSTGSQKETSSGKSSSAHKSTTLEKLSSSALTSERVLEGAINEGSTHKLIVKIPNRAKSPAQGGSGGSQEDPTFMSSRASSPVPLEKTEQSDHTSKNKSDTSRCNVSSDMNGWQNNDLKDVFSRSDGAGSPAVLGDEEQSMTTEDSKRSTEGLPPNQLKSIKLHASSFSPMNALIESCAKYSEATSSLSLEDDVGMNLLASVAAGEMSRSDMVSPTDSTERSTPAVEEVCAADEAKSKSALDAECDSKRQLEFTGNRKCAPSHTSGDIPASEDTKDIGSSSTDLGSNADPKGVTSQKPNEKTSTTTSALPISIEKVMDGESNEEIHEEKATPSNIIADGISNCKSGRIGVVLTEEKYNTDHLSADECKPVVDVAGSKPSDEGACSKFVNEGLNTTANSQLKLTAAVVDSEFAERATNEKLQQTECGQKPVMEASHAVKTCEPHDMDTQSCMSKSEGLNLDEETDRDAAGESHSVAVLCSASNDLRNHQEVAKVENQEISEHISLPESRCPGPVDHEAQKEAELGGSGSASINPDEAGDCASTGAESSSSSAAEASGAKMKFDLNEGLSADDGKYGESVTLTSDSVMVNSLPFSVNSIPAGQSASITVAAAAKGPFVPPEDLLRNKIEVGWKGSAATSAFRPAEPRKVLEMPLGPTNLSSPDASTSKHGRVPLDIDLNVPDERVLEELASRGSALAIDSTTNLASSSVMLLNDASDAMPVRGSGGLDLDLNRVDEANDNGHCSTSSNHDEEASAVHVKPLGHFPAGDVRRGFDLNNGPVADDATAGQLSINQLVKGGATSQLPSAGLRMNSPGLSSFSSWFHPGNTYSAVAIPSALPDRGEQSFPVFPPAAPQRTFGPTGGTPFNTDMYRGSVLSSSPAVPLPSSSFQFSMFPFGTTFPLPSAAFSVGGASYADSSSGARLFAPAVNPQYLGPVGSVAAQFQRPYVVSLPDICSNGGLDSSRKWGRQGFDLNAGPGAMESEVREEMFPLSSSQHSVASSQALAEEQAKMFSVSGGILKRKEPEGGWDNETFRHKQSSWQ